MAVMTKPPEDWTEVDEQDWRRLHELQPTLLPDHAKEIIAIEVETGNYYANAQAGPRSRTWVWPSSRAR